MSNQFSNISLYIPHVFPNYTREDVAEVFENQKIGKVSRIDFISKIGQDGKTYNAAYIHFDFWCDTIANRNLQARVCDPTKEARIVYDEPWHWIVLENKARKYTPGERKPRIDLGDLKPVTAPKPVAASQPAIPVKALAPKPVAEPEPTLAFDDQEFMNLIDEIAQGDDAEDPEDAKFKQSIEEMDECVATMAEEDQCLISVDSRYIQTLEEENFNYRNEIYQLNMRIMELNNSLYSEQIKANALAEAVHMISKN